MMQQAQAVWRTVTRTGTGLIVADDTTEGMPLSIEMQGWTQQDTTTGAQIFDAKSIVKDMVIEQDGNLSSGIGYFTSDFIKVNPSTAYYITATGSKRGKYFDENKQVIFTNTYSDFTPENGTAFTTPEKATYIRFSGLTSQVKSVMLNVGSVPKPYEEYTGGQPSLSTEYQQEILSEGLWNAETQKYERTIKVSNKNLFDKEYASNTKNWKNGENYPYISIFVGKGNTVSFCYSNDLELGLGLYVLISKEPGSTPKSYRWLYHSTTESLINKNGSFVAENNEIYLSVAGANSTLLEKFMDNIGVDLQIEISESPTVYVEHAEQSVTITSDRPVSKWDRLEQRDGVYGWVYKTIRVPDFSEIIEENTPIYGNAGEKYFFVELQNTNLNYDRTKIYSDAGLYQNGIQEKYVIRPYERSVYIGVEDKDTIATAKEHLHCAIQYETTESEEFVPLPEEEQAALKALNTYFPTTVITNDQNLFMQVEYKTKVPEKEG